jgi:hypothetical protein
MGSLLVDYRLLLFGASVVYMTKLLTANVGIGYNSHQMRRVGQSRANLFRELSCF